MTETLRERIVVLLSRDINRLFSISEIAKKLKSAYSHCNKFITELKDENVIKINRIANAHICTLNLNEPLTYGYLAISEYRYLKRWSIKNKKKAAKVNLFLTRLKEMDADIESIFNCKQGIMVMVRDIDNKIRQNLEKAELGFDYIIIKKDNMKDIQDKIIDDHVIFYGAERFWEAIRKDIKLE